MSNPSPARREGLKLGANLARTVAHFWPDLRLWLGQVPDTRDQDQIIYPRHVLLWVGLLLFLTKMGARRQIHYQLDSVEALANLNRLTAEAMVRGPHGDTVEHFLSHVPERGLILVRRQMVQRLIRMKALDEGRLCGHFLVVIDGTGQLHFRERHCPHCLEQTHGDVTYYYHNVLEAKLVTPRGLALSIATEFIENTDPKATKQDCELKAFVRLAQRLKKDYPQLLLCLVMDSLYANGTVMSICEQNYWKYLITFKEGSMPALWTEFQNLCQLARENRRAVQRPGDIRQQYAWINDLEHVDDRKRRHRVNALECREYRPKELQQHRFAWLTNFNVQPDIVATLANDGGRCREKIENQGFNIQKNGGFNLEHAYSTKDRQIHNWYLLMQIAHTILQLLECGNLFGQDAKVLFGSLKNLAQRLLESLRNTLIPAEALDAAAAARIQIRLNSS